MSLSNIGAGKIKKMYINLWEFKMTLFIFDKKCLINNLSQKYKFYKMIWILFDLYFE